MDKRSTPAHSHRDAARDPLFFTPVVLARQRRNGWTAEAQICFVRELARCGSVTAAPHPIGAPCRQ